MPEIKIKHVVSFSSEDSVYKAENLLKPESYRKWKCATAGEKNASVILQFEKASQIHSIDIGNEHSAFVEVLVGRSSDSTNNYEVILVSSSFMSPMESRNSTQANRVRMFTSDKLVQNTKNEKWDQVQIVCTQPFNKTTQYGLSFIKFHSPPELNEETPKEKTVLKLGAFKLKDDDDDEDPLPVGKWFSKRNEKPVLSDTGPTAIRQASSFATTVLNNSPKDTMKESSKLKRRSDDNEMSPVLAKKKESTIAHVNRNKVGYKAIDKQDSDSEEILLPSYLQAPKEKTSELPKPVKNTPKKTRPKAKKTKKNFNKLMENVVFVISGFQNPLRSTIRDNALEMGAQYKGDWDSSCTHLICAFINTPKYNTVRGKGGRIVKKEWIFDCHKKKELLPWRRYMLGDYSKSTTEEEDEEESEDETVKTPSPKRNQVTKSPVKKVNGIINSPSSKNLNLPSTSKELKDEEDNEETDAESDYKADTDIENSSGGGDTEDEIRRVEENSKKCLKDSPKQSPVKRKLSPQKSPSPKKKKLEETEPVTDNLPLPVLPNYFKSKKFLLYGDFEDEERHNLHRYITAYNGHVCDYMSDEIKYVVTSSKWNDDFENALSENEDIIFVRPQWIHKCHEKEKCVPFQPYIVIPDS